jgi:hypothetical protein
LLFVAAAEAQHIIEEVVMAEYREVVAEAESAAIGRFPVSTVDVLYKPLTKTNSQGLIFDLFANAL